MKAGIVVSGFLALLMVTPAVAQNCGISTSKMYTASAVQQQALIAMQSGQRARACSLLLKIKNQVEEDIEDYQACGNQGLVVTAEGLLDSIISNMTQLKCD